MYQQSCHGHSPVLRAALRSGGLLLGLSLAACGAPVSFEHEEVEGAAWPREPHAREGSGIAIAPQASAHEGAAGHAALPDRGIAGAEPRAAASPAQAIATAVPGSSAPELPDEAEPSAAEPSAAAASSPEVIAEPLQAEDPAVMSWEEYRDAAAIELGGEIKYRVEWDLVVTLDELRVHYEAHRAARTGVENKGTVRNVSGNDVLLSDALARDINYCVSTGFGTNYARAVQEVQAAVRYWSSQANVRFHYFAGSDSNCNQNSANIDLPFVPHSGGGAWSFFPDGTGGCAGKTGTPDELCIDYNDFDNDPSGFWGMNAPNIETTNVFIHEMGHFFGLVHEHNRAAMPLPPFVNCPLDGVSNWRAVTDYEQSSTMHYPWCNGNANTTLGPTARDGLTLRKLYGLPAGWYAPIMAPAME